MAFGSSWIRTLWQFVDGLLKSVSDGAKAALKTLRILRAVLVVMVLTVIISAVGAIAMPQYLNYYFAASIVFVALPLIILMVLVMLPFRAKSLVRLIDQGYPDNAKELAIRAAAKKMRDESIDTEELLVETGLNEGKKVYRRYKRRAELLKRQLDEMDEDASSSSDAGRDASGRPAGEDEGGRGGPSSRDDGYERDGPP